MGLQVKYHAAHDHRTTRGLAIQRKHAVKYFLLNKSSLHSACAVTLPFIMEYLEQNEIPYLLHAAPGSGYFIETDVERRVIK